jgi:methylmalonyl-CoA/ethylmalonyl-CoA epimerase
MIKKISHIGIAVKNLEISKDIYKQLLQSEPAAAEIVTEQKVKVVKFMLNGISIELLEPTADDSPIAKFIEKRGEGIHHIAYESDNINEELDRLDSRGFELINRKPLVGSDNMKIAFIKPKSLLGVLTEICQH